MEMLKRIGKIAAGVVGLGLVAYAASSCFREPETVTPSERDYREVVIQTRYYWPEGSIPSEGYIWDMNNDGVADAVGFMGMARWYSDDWHGKNALEAVKMTPEIRDAATEAMKSGRNLAKLLTENMFEESQKKEGR